MSLVNRLVRKTKYVKELEAFLDADSDHIRYQDKTIGDLKVKIQELENTNLGAYDMNILFGAIISYHDVVTNRLCAADPIIFRGDIRHIFDKYQVKLPK